VERPADPHSGSRRLDQKPQIGLTTAEVPRQLLNISISDLCAD
jgi:hypothetical protein